jgi:hypothetical protein
MEFNPYAPPKASVADAEPDTHGLKHCSLWLMVVLVRDGKIAGQSFAWKATPKR